MNTTMRVPKVIASRVARIAESTEAQPLIAQAHGTSRRGRREAGERQRERHAHEERERRDQGEREEDLGDGRASRPERRTMAAGPRM